MVVDFWAEWCGPCHALTPVLEQEVERRDGEVVLAKVDVDANRAWPRRIGVQGIPAVKAFRDGRVVAEFVGRACAGGRRRLSSTSCSRRRVSRASSTSSGRAASCPTSSRRSKSGDEERALELILDEIAASSPERAERLGNVGVAVFHDLGHDDPLTVAYRRRLATALY